MTEAGKLDRTEVGQLGKPGEAEGQLGKPGEAERKLGRSEVGQVCKKKSQAEETVKGTLLALCLPA
jgi:hypothetical protein